MKKIPYQLMMIEMTEMIRENNSKKMTKKMKQNITAKDIIKTNKEGTINAHKKVIRRSIKIYFIKITRKSIQI